MPANIVVIKKCRQLIQKTPRQVNLLAIFFNELKELFYTVNRLGQAILHQKLRIDEIEFFSQKMNDAWCELRTIQDQLVA